VVELMVVVVEAAATLDVVNDAADVVDDVVVDVGVEEKVSTNSAVTAGRVALPGKLMTIVPVVTDNEDVFVASVDAGKEPVAFPPTETAPDLTV